MAIDIMMLSVYSILMRTTINLAEPLLEEANRAALERRVSMTALIEEALREKLSRLKSQEPAAPYRAVTFQGNGLQSGVDLDDSAALLERMEGAGDVPL